MRKCHLIKNIALLLILPTVSLAASGHEAHGIPWKTVVFQCINVTILLFLLFRFTKKPIQKAFEERRNTYLAKANKAGASLKEAETQNLDIKSRLKKLEEGFSAAVQKARAEAEQLKKNIIADADLAAKKAETDARESIRYEAERAKKELVRELVDSAVSSSKRELSSDLKDSDHKALQVKFVERLAEK